MERGSSKHGPRLDNEMEHEVRGMLQGKPGSGGRVEEWHDPEPSGEDQPGTAELIEPDRDRPAGTVRLRPHAAARDGADRPHGRPQPHVHAGFSDTISK